MKKLQFTSGQTLNATTHLSQVNNAKLSKVMQPQMHLIQAQASSTLNFGSGSFHNNITSNSAHFNGNIGSQNGNGVSNKKELNYLKVNKQSSMLHMHHHNLNQPSMVSNMQPFQSSSHYNGEKINSSFCQISKHEPELAVNHKINIYPNNNQMSFKEMQMQDQENRGLQSNQGEVSYLNSSIIEGAQCQQNFNNIKKSKFQSKDQKMRRNSQDKVINTSSSMALYNKDYANETVMRHRPQTSNRIATKNTFMNTNASLPQQQLQPKVHELVNNQNNKENVNNNGAVQPVLSINNFQRQVDKVSSIGTIFSDNGARMCQEEKTTEIERECIHVNENYGEDIDEYNRELELQFNAQDNLKKHKITPVLRARMVDWMIEVLTNFKCDDQTFFLAISILDRYFKGKKETREVSDLHIIGVTSMFIASKYEDIYPLKMKMVFEKIAHKKIPIEKIKSLETDILKVITYKIPAPTALDFLKVYLKDVMNIGKPGKPKSLSLEKKDAQPVDKSMNALIEKMSVYLAKMSLHDYELSGKRPSLQAVGSLYVALKISEQLKKAQLITNEIVCKLVSVSKAKEEDIIEVSQRVLYLAQNFEKAFPGLENLKKTHFVNITQLL